MAEPQQKGRISRLLVRIGAGVGGVLAIVASTIASVYEVRTRPEIPLIEPGEAVEAGRWNIRINSATIATQTPDGLQLRDGKSALVVDIDLENRTGTTSSVYYQALELTEPPAGADPQPLFFLKRDRAFLNGLNPRMPEAVQVVWRLSPDAVRPRNIELRIAAESFKPKDNLYAAPGWFNPHTVGRVLLPVRDEAE
ncbi:MAG: hypothetical protein ACRECW_06180 [Phyllobacterium sp.]